jgi:hypothetical protein
VKKIAAMLMLALPMLAFAQAPATPRVDQRQANQEARIQQGVQSGALTPKEAARLEKGQDRVANLEDKAKADGTVTAKERARLKHAQDKQSARIYRQKHDAQTDVNHDGKVDHPKKKHSQPQ